MLFIADTPKHNRVKTDVNIQVKNNTTISSNAKVSDRYTKHNRGKSLLNQTTNQEISDSWGTMINVDLEKAI